MTKQKLFNIYTALAELAVNDLCDKLSEAEIMVIRQNKPIYDTQLPKGIHSMYYIIDDRGVCKFDTPIARAVRARLDLKELGYLK
jgi:hypothetical protein